MHREIIWSPLAEEDLSIILDYLANHWELNVTLAFLNKLDIVIRLIADFPEQYPIIQARLQIRKCVITKHNSLFYRIHSDRIEILRIYDTRQDPNQLTFL